MNLRRWQRDAVAQCLRRFRQGHPHFLCLATPGAGKTYMSSTVAKKLLRGGEIDFVFCFSPSVNVSESFRSTLELVLGCRMDGLLGAKGTVLTYQAMLNLDQTFWSLITSHRTLVIFDEIHHCAGDQLGNANAWGQQIIDHIQGKATYTLALTGTPWRSDRIPIALTSYCREGNVHCDYIYGLAEAIDDGVCRRPKIVVIDNEKISVKTEDSEEHYQSFADLLKSSRCSYQHLLENTTLIRYLLEFSQKNLNALRKVRPDAGGLIVAASVEHALVIAGMVEDMCGESPTVVTYLHDDSQEANRQFRSSRAKWIVSVGMISEGTDIPRLQVCCHLTRVKTELSFRQVLGRILRVQDQAHEEAVFIMPAEPNLMEYAHRVAEDIPSSTAISVKLMEESIAPVMQESTEGDRFCEPLNNVFDLPVPGCTGAENLPNPITLQEPHADLNPPVTSLAEAYETTLGLFGRFKKRMIHLSSQVG